MNQYKPLLRAVSRTLRRLGILHQVERGEPLTADRNLRMEIVTRRGDLRDAPNREYPDKSILLDVTHDDPQEPEDLRVGIVDHDGSTFGHSRTTV